MQAPRVPQEDLEPKVEKDPWCNTSTLCLWRITPVSPGVLESSGDMKGHTQQCTCFCSEETLTTDSSASLAQALTSPANAQVTSCRQPVARSLNIHRAAWASSTWDGSSSYDLDSKTWLSWKLPPIPRSHAQERSLEAMPMITTFPSLSQIPPKPVL